MYFSIIKIAIHTLTAFNDVFSNYASRNREKIRLFRHVNCTFNVVKVKIVYNNVTIKLKVIRLYEKKIIKLINF